MRVLLVTDFYAPHVGGVELQVQALGQALAERGDDVAVATVRQPGLPAEEMDGQVRLVRMPGLFTWAPWFSSSRMRRYHPPFADPVVAVALRRLVRSFRPDVVQAHGWIAHSAALGLVGTSTRLIVSVNDFGYTCATRTLLLNGQICSGPEVVKCLRHAARVYGTAKGIGAVAGVFGSRPWLARRTRLVRSVSTYVETIMQRDLFHGRAEPGRIVTIPDIVLAERPLPTGTDEDPKVGMLPGVPYILFVGALQPHKGIGTLLDAYRRLVKPPPLVLVGTRGPDTPDRYPSDVTVIENLEHSAVMRAWDRALFGVAPSICADALPGVVREAMSRGAPVIGTRVGGIVDMIEDRVNGLLVAPGDADGLATAMQELVDDGELRANLGAQARRDVARFVPDAIGAAFDRLYERALVPSGLPPTTEMRPARVHVAGGSGTGKTTLAARLGILLDAPVHSLDEIARDVTTGRIRSVDERTRMVSKIATGSRWVTEGIHVGWTDELCRRADLIIWLDQVGWPTALARVVRRFSRSALQETRGRGLRGIVRPRSYVRHLAELYRAGRDIRGFDRTRAADTGDGGSRAATTAQLAPYATKVVQCRSRDDVEGLIVRIARPVGSRPAGSPR